MDGAAVYEESRRPARKRGVLTVLTLVYALSFLDQNLIILLVEPIKRDLKLSDTELGFLTGIVFGLLYALLGLPVARWADRGNRVTIAALATALWGATVMLCLFVSNFFQLALARIAASVADSACMPPTYSLLGDHFPGAAERTRAMTVYMMGSSAASLVAFVAGGFLNNAYGWRVTLFMAGIPGLLVAVLVKLSIAEPRRSASGTHEAIPVPGRVAEALKILWGQRSLRHLSLGIIVFFTLAAGLAPWYAAFMIRCHGMNTAELGIWLGLIFGIGGMSGTLLGGYVVGRWFRGDEPGQMRLVAAVIAALAPCCALFLLVPHRQQALVGLTLFVVALNFFFGPTFALLQRLVGAQMRATTLAIVMSLANMIGMGIGPQTVGMLSDSLRPILANDSLRYAMLFVSLLSFWSAYHFWRVASSARADLLVERGGNPPNGFA